MYSVIINRFIRHLVLLRNRNLFQVLSLFITALLLLSTVCAIPALQAASIPIVESKECLEVPYEYGEVIYRVNPQSSRQLYIIGTSHLNVSTGVNCSTTVEAQKEIYRIGEWLKKSGRLELLLPEGYFNEIDCSVKTSQIVRGKNELAGYFIDNTQLEKELSGKAFVNAEILLMEHLKLPACQVENRTIYHAVRGSLDKLLNAGIQPADFQQAIKDIRFQQEVRSAQLLQDIPGIIEEQYNHGTIVERSALLTIGLNHIKHIF